MNEVSGTSRVCCGGGQTDNPFDLPQTISRRLKRCMEAHQDGDKIEGDKVEYLWIDVTTGASGDKRPEDARKLTIEDWLNVVDEAASIGCCCLLVRVDESLFAWPGLFTLCQWAQTAHDMMVGLHTHARSLAEEDLEKLRELNQGQTCLFIDEDAFDEMKHLQDRGISLCPATVRDGSHEMPCTMAECMVFVGAEGRLYTCGMVHGDHNFCFGSILDQRLAAVVADPSLPRTITAEMRASMKSRSCDGCPPIMSQRVRH
ncbi:MAG: hypothetical protein QG656_1547 [Candidatus Hydrogenedentes bacterium]|nr:hypothetical protein [Candidatus Hydrogenedentota bacterium]